MSGKLAFRPMREADLGLVRYWLRQPHVARWYLADSTLEQEVEELRQSLTGEQPTHVLVVLERDRPIGWCQWYWCRDYPDHAAGIRAAPDDIGVDYAIGDAERIGQGVGTAVIAALVAHIRLENPTAGIVADPAAANTASRRVLEKCGFKLIREGPVASEATDAAMAIYRLAP